MAADQPSVSLYLATFPSGHDEDVTRDLLTRFNVAGNAPID